MLKHTVASLIETVCRQFEKANLSYGHGTDNAWDEAVALVLDITEATDERSSLEIEVSPETARRCRKAADERMNRRVPLGYVLGRCRYMGYQFKVRPGVMVPRSPIGYLLGRGLEPWLPERVENILDLCSGTGCLGIIAAHLYPEARVTLVELDAKAAEVARENIEAHGLASRIHLICGDVTQPMEFANPFDLVIANPPYVDTSDMHALPREHRAEPHQGLAAGSEGLSVMMPIIAQLSRWLANHGLFVGEVGASSRALMARYPTLGFIWPDLPDGGEGVFVLEASSLTSHTAPDMT